MGTDQCITLQQDDDEEKKCVYDFSWMHLPSEPLISILLLLSHKDLAHASQVCHRWNEIANLSLIWRRRLRIDFNISPDVPMLSTATSWKAEYQRMTDLVPSVEFERISEHTDEVLHVSFSNNGMMFCTCSKDATVKVFNADWPFNTMFNEELGHLSQFRWMYTQFSQFSSSDTQLLVSGRCAGSQQGGEIIIYNIFHEEFTLQSRVRIMPYDVMGTWLNETHILSAKAHRLFSQRKYLCEVLLNKSSQEVEDLRHSTVIRSFMFGCDNYNTISYLQVADLKKTIANVHRSLSLGCFHGKLHDMHVKALAQHKSRTKQVDVKPEACCVSQPVELNTGFTVSSISVKVARTYDNAAGQSSDSASNDNSKKLKMDEGWKGSNSVANNEEPIGFNLLPPSIKRCMAETDNDSDSSNVFSGTASPQLTDDELDRDESESTEATTGDESALHLNPPASYKLLLCFTGSEFDVPHQVGIKRIIQEECTEVVCPEFDLAKLRHLRHRNSSEEPAPNRPDIKTDSWDHVIEMSGQVVGMSVSPCNRFIFVNVRKWIDGVVPDDLIRTPAISSHVTMHMFDLLSMEEVKCFTGHNAVSDVFFLHISCNNLYVTSGSEDKQGYLWDKHYGVLISTFRHEGVVNCVAVNPRDPSMAVSVSDDNVIKIWRSKSFHRLLKGARAKARSKAPGMSI